MYRLNQADKIYSTERTKRQRAQQVPLNRVTIGEYPTVKEAALKLKEMRKLHPDKTFYVSSTWNKPKKIKEKRNANTK